MLEYKVTGSFGRREAKGLFVWHRPIFSIPWRWKRFEAQGEVWHHYYIPLFGMFEAPFSFHFDCKGREPIDIAFDNGPEVISWFEFEGRSWHLREMGPYAVLLDDKGEEVARAVEAWKDSDSKAGIKTHLKIKEGLSPVLAAIVCGLSMKVIFVINKTGFRLTPD